jgi:hypothetical protein
VPSSHRPFAISPSVFPFRHFKLPFCPIPISHVCDFAAYYSSALMFLQFCQFCHFALFIVVLSFDLGPPFSWHDYMYLTIIGTETVISFNFSFILNNPISWHNMVYSEGAFKVVKFMDRKTKTQLTFAPVHRIVPDQGINLCLWSNGTFVNKPGPRYALPCRCSFNQCMRVAQWN